MAPPNDKADTLIHKLMFATLSVVLLVLLALGWREAIVVGSAVILTLALTLFAFTGSAGERCPESLVT